MITHIQFTITLPLHMQPHQPVTRLFVTDLPLELGLDVLRALLHIEMEDKDFSLHVIAINAAHGQPLSEQAMKMCGIMFALDYLTPLGQEFLLYAERTKQPALADLGNRLIEYCEKSSWRKPAAGSA